MFSHEQLLTRLPERRRQPYDIRGRPGAEGTIDGACIAPVTKEASGPASRTIPAITGSSVSFDRHETVHQLFHGDIFPD
ncbi:hypothetical protein KCP77_14010 [Salmonella enterica subsp. enterica]|nr:hypothetical protein KCP77_14010 [Salmonella enterica subsp. enterica]